MSEVPHSRQTPDRYGCPNDLLATIDDFDLYFLVSAVAAADGHQKFVERAAEEFYDALKKEEHNRRRRKGARDGGYSHRAAYPSWEEICENPTHRHVFRKKYRMTFSQFVLLCQKIEGAVGEKEFLPDRLNFRKKFVSGEIRVAVGLRMLCGGSYIDYVGRSYGFHSISSVYVCFDKFIDWVNKTFDFPLVDLIKNVQKGNEEAIKK